MEPLSKSKTRDAGAASKRRMSRFHVLLLLCLTLRLPRVHLSWVVWCLVTCRTIVVVTSVLLHQRGIGDTLPERVETTTHWTTGWMNRLERLTQGYHTHRPCQSKDLHYPHLVCTVRGYLKIPFPSHFKTTLTTSLLRPVTTYQTSKPPPRFPKHQLRCSQQASNKALPSPTPT